ncbi:hypothetical protein FQR65_LT19517 [Abscondita terminalis]|nr:hypothetical protein FQR65_LT19517 [Abscondita terminalis]
MRVHEGAKVYEELEIDERSTTRSASDVMVVKYGRWVFHKFNPRPVTYTMKFPVERSGLGSPLGYTTDFSGGMFRTKNGESPEFQIKIQRCGRAETCRTVALKQLANSSRNCSSQALSAVADFGLYAA